jgi:hypothetical protein
MSKADVIKTYIPEFLRNSQVLLSILNADGADFDQLITSLNNILLQFYVETAVETGLTLWEQFLGLSSYAGKPLDQRRSRIISKLRGMGTVTIALIKNVAESYIYGHVTVTEHPETYSFTIKFIDPLGIPANLADVQAAIADIKPAHLGVIYEFTYTTWGEIATITWADVATGTWGELKTRTVV